MRAHDNLLGRLLVVGAAAFAPLSVSVPAAADTVQGTRSEKVNERSHKVRLRMDRLHAELVVERTVYNGGPRYDQARFWLNLPKEAVATGLRTLGTQDGKPVWFSADLMEAEAALTKYQQLTGFGTAFPKDPALLSWEGFGSLTLQVFPVAPSQTKTVEYTLEMPVHYRSGRYHVELPMMGTETRKATLTVEAIDAKDVVIIDDKRVPRGTQITLDTDSLDIALERRSPPALEGGLAWIPLRKDMVLSHFHVEAAPRISRVPRGAHVVVLVDTSRSLSRFDVAAEIAAARATLVHFPDALVSVVPFDRKVRPTSQGFVPVAKAISSLQGISLERNNGSRIDDALAFADNELANVPASSPKRILVMTDFLTRSELTPERLAKVIRSGALVHFGDVSGNGSQLVRADDHPWADIARKTGGVVWQMAWSADDTEMKRIYEEWARPVRIHKLKLTGLDISNVPESLDEGAGFEDFNTYYDGEGHVELSGELWATPTRKDFTRSDDEAQKWSAFAFGSDSIFPSLNTADMMPLARRGHVVSPVTSFLAVEPGVRPSTEGLVGVGEGGGGRGEGIGLGSIGAIGHGGSSFNPREALRDAVRGVAQACGASDRKVSVELESTLAEIVDVRSVTVSGTPDTTLQHCLEEGVWDVKLDAEFDAAFATWKVEVG